MLKKLFFGWLIVLPFIGTAQNNDTGIPIPMKKSIIYYDKSFPVPGGFRKQEFYKAVTHWYDKRFPGLNNAFQIGAPNIINCTGAFKITTSQNGNYYLLKFKMEIAFSDSDCTIRAYNFLN